MSFAVKHAVVYYCCCACMVVLGACDNGAIEISILKNYTILYYVKSSSSLPSIPSIIQFDISLENPVSCYTVRYFSNDYRPLADGQKNIWTFNNGYFVTASSTDHQFVPHNIIFQRQLGNTECTFALPHTPLNVSYSNVHRMRSSGLIRRNAFAIELTHDKVDQTLYIGNVPAHKHSEYPHQLRLPAESDDPGDHKKHWSFAISALRIGERTLHVVRKAKLSISNDFMVVDEEIYVWLRETLMSEHLRKGSCVERDGNWRTFRCEEAVTKALPSLCLVVKGRACVEIKLSEVASNGDISVGWNRGLDGLGHVFVNRNVFYGKVIEFDYDENRITIHAKAGDANSVGVLLTRRLLCCEWVVTAIGAIWLVTVRALLITV